MTGCMTTILFVDDEPDLEALVLQKFRRQIREGAMTVIFAHDGLEALETLEKHPQVDMVVSDINMPRMDGLSLLAKLQEAEDKKSTIIVSAYGDMSNIRTAMNRGAFDFLTKPIDLSDLEVTIDKTIHHVEMLREARLRQAEAERAHASLSRYFSPEIARRLASGNEESNGMEVQWRDVAIVFTDITGFTTLVETAPPEVRARRPDVPVIMITAYGDADTRRKAMERGAEGLLTKPIDFALLRQEIDNRLGQAA